MNQKYSKKIAAFISITLLTFVQHTGYSQESTTSLKVMTYNIWNGFDWGKDLDRKAELTQWVKSQDLDVLALQELCSYTQEQLRTDAKKWGHNYAVLLKTSGYSVGISSKEPIKLKEKILDNMHHGALHCEIAGIDYFVIHFSPHNRAKRHEESTIIRNKLSQLSEQQNKYMVLGDFNALSPFDAHLYTGNSELLAAKRKSESKRDEVRNLLKSQLDYGVISSLLGFPMIDVTQKFTSTWDERVSFPSQVFEIEKGEGRAATSTRIDYILCSPFLATKCTNAKVLNNKESFYLSDHYPVVAEFNLEITKRN